MRRAEHGDLKRCTSLETRVGFVPERGQDWNWWLQRVQAVVAADPNKRTGTAVTVASRRAVATKRQAANLRRGAHGGMATDMTAATDPTWQKREARKSKPGQRQHRPTLWRVGTVRLGNEPVLVRPSEAGVRAKASRHCRTCRACRQPSGARIWFWLTTPFSSWDMEMPEHVLGQASVLGCAG